MLSAFCYKHVNLRLINGELAPQFVSDPHGCMVAPFVMLRAEGDLRDI